MDLRLISNGTNSPGCELQQSTLKMTDKLQLAADSGRKKVDAN